MATAEYDGRGAHSTRYVDSWDILKKLSSSTEKKDHHYLRRVSDVVRIYRGKPVRLQETASLNVLGKRNLVHPVLKIGGLDHTIYQGEKGIVEEWGNFYLPDRVKMKVVGVVEGYPCQSGQLVLMTCEDERLFAYDAEELHVVASSLGDVFEKGFKYPGIETFYRGEHFKDMTESDWAEVRKGSVGKRLDQAHLKLVREEKSSFMECLQVIQRTRKMAEDADPSQRQHLKT